MHITEAQQQQQQQQPPENILTKCAKMTEEAHSRRHGMNGSADAGGGGGVAATTTTTTRDECHHHLRGGTPNNKDDYTAGRSAYSQGGRLKFYKDGKFILELERAREGERVSWVSVQRKTFWPPQGTAPATTPTYRQESSTSLSVSDDNSSIQSSPWQRDHSWKQTSPRRSTSTEMNFYFWRPKCKRRPASASSVGKKQQTSPGQSPDSANNPRREEDAPGGAIATRTDNTIVYSNGNNVCNSNSSTSTSSNMNNNKVNNNNNNGNSTRGVKVRLTLLSVVQALLEKSKAAAVTTTANATSGTPPPRPETVVSPRKRFLREMERDGKGTSAEDACQKRSRNKTVPGSNSKAPASSPLRVNGVASEEAQQQSQPRPAAPPRNSYSITSLLAEDYHRPPARHRSPDNSSASPSHFPSPPATSSGASAPIGGPQQQQYCSPSPEERWYTESVDRLRSIELSQADKRALSYTPYPFIPPYMYSYSLPPPPYYSAAAAAAAAASSTGMYGRGYVVPPVYPAAPPLPVMVKQETPSCSWIAEQSRDATNEHRDENITDMPLNLSKHAG